MTTVEEFIARNGIRSVVRPAKENPAMQDEMPGASHWNVTLIHDGRRMTVPFSQGSAHTKPPTTAEVLDCVRSDATTLGDDSETVRYGFEEWAEELGYDPDSRRAERTYRAVVDQTERLRGLLGRGAYADLLTDVEGL